MNHQSQIFQIKCTKFTVSHFQGNCQFLRQVENQFFKAAFKFKRFSKFVGTMHKDCNLHYSWKVTHINNLLSPHGLYLSHVRSKWVTYITEICAELLLARWVPHFDYNSSTGGPAGNLGAVAGSSDPWRCGLASPSMGSRINSAGVLPHFAEDDPPVGAFEWDRSVSQWMT